jgi:hypothetical protein
LCLAENNKQINLSNFIAISYQYFPWQQTKVLPRLHPNPRPLVNALEPPTRHLKVLRYPQVLPHP